jgi:Protein of unknown function (DUF3662)/FHA domain
MGILGRFEKKVEGAVSGVFARAFKGDVQPVEIVARLQRELDAESKLVSRDRRLVPNEFTVNLSQHDHDKLVPYASTLVGELATELKKHAGEMGYVFSGPIKIRFKLDPGLPVGRFTVTSQVVAGVEAPQARSPRPNPPQAGASRPPTMPRPEPSSAEPGRKRPNQAPSPNELVLEVNGTRYPLTEPGLTIGRGTDADLRINDPGISRIHAEIRVSGSGADQRIDIVDLGSTNGLVINGEKVRQSVLLDGTRIQIGSTRMLVHHPSER